MEEAFAANRQLYSFTICKLTVQEFVKIEKQKHVF